MLGGPFFIIISLEIVAMTVVLHFLARAHKEELSRGLKLAGKVLLTVGFIIMAFTIAHGIMGMAHRMHDGGGTDQCCPMMGHHGCMMHQGCMNGGCCAHDGCMNGGCNMHDGNKCSMDSMKDMKGGKCPMMDKDGKTMHMDKGMPDSAAKK